MVCRLVLSAIPSDSESSRIDIATLIVAYYSDEPNHYLAASSLGAWLKENGVPAIFGVDMRPLTQKIREQGSMLGKVLAKWQGLLFRSQSLAAAVAGSQNVSPAPSPSRGLWTEEYLDIPFRIRMLEIWLRGSLSPIASPGCTQSFLRPLDFIRPADRFES
jgi:carbamoyl-phosphate synthase / aspartate carbamoyltransferase